jgi:hypothetical protein
MQQWYREFCFNLYCYFYWLNRGFKWIRKKVYWLNYTALITYIKVHEVKKLSVWRTYSRVLITFSWLVIQIKKLNAYNAVPKMKTAVQTQSASIRRAFDFPEWFYNWHFCAHQTFHFYYYSCCPHVFFKQLERAKGFCVHMRTFEPRINLSSDQSALFSIYNIHIRERCWTRPAYTFRLILEPCFWILYAHTLVICNDCRRARNCAENLVNRLKTSRASWNLKVCLFEGFSRVQVMARKDLLIAIMIDYLGPAFPLWVIIVRGWCFDSFTSHVSKEQRQLITIYKSESEFEAVCFM